MLKEIGPIGEGTRTPLFCKLLPIEWAGRYLLPPEVRNNLQKGIPIRSNLINGKLVPYLYPDDWISAVSGYCLSKQSLHSSEAFRENIQQFLQTFHLPNQLPVIRKRIPNDNYLSLYKRGVEGNMFINTDDIEPPNKKRIFMHGRFNGFPQPAILETVLLVKKMFPDCEFYLGIDHDASSEELGQASFMDIQFRASLLARTGLFDKIILLEPPGNDYSQRDRDSWWDLLYSISGYLDPAVIVYGKERINKGVLQQVSVRTEVIFPGNLSRHVRVGMHQSTIKSGATSVEEVKHGWDVIRRLLSDPGET